ncbi:MAG: alpha/beta hydrolase [Acidobacteria bacterium]|nr:alpha/beta hydrolase [Acidobacteriota bacterium]MCB9378126.1 alpha/beta hydrolase [Holophagales bacterium]
MRRRWRWTLGILGVLLVAFAALFVWFVRNPLEAFERSRRRELLSAGFVRSDLGAGEERIALFVAGEGPGLLFLHGLGDQAGSWASIAPAFAGRYRVFVADLPGHGESGPAGDELEMSTIVAGAERLLDVAAAEGPATIVGNSLGAWLATLLARERPERVARLVLVNGGALRGEGGGPSLAPKDRAEAGRLMALLRDPSSPAVPGFVLDDVIRRAADGPISKLGRDLPGLEAHLLDGRLGAIATPVDLLWGSSDRLIPLDYARRMLAELPAARLTEVERCGHVPQVECPDRFLPALERVLALPPPAPAPATPDGETPESPAITEVTEVAAP